MDIKELYKLYQQHPCITTDSRNCPEGSIFLALKGASFDGNQYALSALEKGCAYAIIDNPEYKKDTTAYKPSKTWRASIVVNLRFLLSALQVPTERQPPRS